MRRCVICGERPPLRDAEGNVAYAYPKTEEEARIWQTSMAAKECSVQSIQKECCVCVEHIPEFVSRAKAIGKKQRKEAREAKLLADEKPKEIVTDECVQCPDSGEPAEDREKPSVSVLLLNGSSLPTYCAEGKFCSCVESRPAEQGDSNGKATKRIKPMGSDTEIIVLESGFQDTGGKFPDIDGTELTRLRAPTQDEDELVRLQKDLVKEEEENEDPNVRRRRDSCLPGCTDVLLLGRGQHETDVCPCQCDQCKKIFGLSDPDPCSLPECCPKCEPEYFTQPPCGCACERQVRRELGKVIKTQTERIRELEELLCRQNNMRNCLQRKLDELYCEFGRLDEAENESYRSGVTCPGSRRGGPDCASVLSGQPSAQPETPQPESNPRSIFSKISLKKRNIAEAPSKVIEEQAPPRIRVHGFAEQKPEIAKHTRRPKWVNKAESVGQFVNRTLVQNPSIKFTEFPMSSGVVNFSASTIMLSRNADFKSQASLSRSDATKPNSKTSLSRSINSDVTISNSRTNHSRSNYAGVTKSNHSIPINPEVIKSNNSIFHRSRA